jgi:hypothetical protein
MIPEAQRNPALRSLKGAAAILMKEPLCDCPVGRTKDQGQWPVPICLTFRKPSCDLARKSLILHIDFDDHSVFEIHVIFKQLKFRVARNPSRVDANCGDHFLQADFSVLVLRDGKLGDPMQHCLSQKVSSIHMLPFVFER